MKQVTLEMAEKALAASARWASDIAGFACSIAVVNEAGAVIAVHRMDGAAALTVDIAIEKAWSTASFNLSTALLARMVDYRKVGKQLGDHGLGLLGKSKGRFTPVAGGVPITNENAEVIGAIGASGVPPDMGDISDTSVSQIGVSALYDFYD
ncbi:MAG: heme-binding protein [Dehalococcoidia bacterium]|nr:heme-binding protein [Dehalococcoidia bacterium]